MLTEQTYARLISAIYDAALEFERWPVALELLTEILSATGGCLIRQNRVTREGRMFNVRSDPKFGERYNQYYHKLNILPERAQGQMLATCLTDRMILPKEEFFRTEFYNDYLRSFKVKGVLKTYVLEEGNWESYISFGRPSTASSDWEAEHIDLLRIFAPHLQRAAQSNLRLQTTRLTLENAVEILSRSSQGVIVVDDKRQPTFLNRPAEAMVAKADGIAIRDRELRLFKKSETAALHRLIATATQRNAGAAAGGTLLVSRASKRQPYSVLVMPLCGGSGLFFVPESARAIIFIQDCGEASPSIDGAYVRTLYGLTRMEAALTVELMRNDGLQAAADVLGIAHSTAKSYLKRIFEKVGVHRQTELLRRLAKFPDRERTDSIR
jgi:DNA-binding CsgD family transcriptional regulator